MNDTHGYYDLHPEMFIEENEEKYRNAGGYARIATIVEETRKGNHDSVLLFDNGDTFHGTYPVVSTKGEGLVPILNEMGFDAMTAHWEFAYGPEQVKRLVDMLNYPMLACNCYDEDTDELVFPPYTIIERAGLKIGVIGIAEHIIDKTMPAHFSEGVYFTLGVEETKKLIPQLKDQEQVDLIILLSHFGFPQEVKLAQEIDGIDILLSGHTHNTLVEPIVVHDTILMQSGCHGAHIGQITLQVKNKQINDYKHSLIEVAEEIPEQPRVKKQIDLFKAPFQEKLQEPIGLTKTPLHRYNQLETTMDNLLLASLLHVSGAEIAFSNGWRYGAPITVGPITENDLWNIIPTNPPVSTVQLTGKEIIDMLEDNLENTFAADPYKQMGGYMKRCLGITMYIKIENPAGTRIQHLFIGNEKVENDRMYDAAFVTVQGVPKKYGTHRMNLDLHAIDALRKYIAFKKEVSIPLQNTVRIV